MKSFSPISLLRKPWATSCTISFSRSLSKGFSRRGPASEDFENAFITSAVMRLSSQISPACTRDRKSTRLLQSPVHLVCRLLLEKKKVLTDRRDLSDHGPARPPTASGCARADGSFAQRSAGVRNRRRLRARRFGRLAGVLRRRRA